MKSLITKRSQRIITIIIALVLLLNCSTFTSAKQVEPDNGQWESKIEEDLREAMEAASDDEYIPVWLWRKSIDKDELNRLIFEKTGYDPEIYEDITLFNERILPEIEEEVRMNQGSDVGPIRQAANLILMENKSEWNEDSLFKAVTRNRINDYIHQKRAVAREEYSKRNREFLEDALVQRDDRRILFCSKYTSTIIVEATKSEILALASNESVESISLYVEFESEPYMYDALSQVGVYSEGGTGFDQTGFWSALTGMHIKIGVLEVFNGTGGKFDATAPMLNGNTNLHFIENVREDGSNVPSAPSTHATEVVSVIAGKSVVYNGKTYCGVVPDAIIYQTPAIFANDYLTGLEACVDNDVIIINISMGGLRNTYYSDIDQQIDKYVRDHNVTIVVAAGNDSGNVKEVRSPGRAFNVITVGNAETKTNPDTLLSAPYSLHYSSCYSEASYCANKPDLVAPGCFNVLMKDESNQVYPQFCVGTSFSAPIVTGIVAQLFERDLIYSLHPTMAKAALLVGADLSQIDITNDTQSTPFFYDKCGAGMVNAINTNINVNIAYLDQITNSTTTAYRTLSLGDRFRAVLTFSKNNETVITQASVPDDLDLLLVKRDIIHGDTLIDYSQHYTNNNEIIDVTIPETGEYYLIIYRRTINDSNQPPTACVMYKCNP